MSLKDKRVYNTKGQEFRPCPFLMEKPDQGLQFDSPVAHHLGDSRIAVR
ncbi:hypothetical protein GYMC10_3188 [Paenibacillus sp. Y412MC10]|nr:hypothetical protein GYMC10_3188 [Paenibacillus sp. Y412MC10]